MKLKLAALVALCAAASIARAQDIVVLPPAEAHELAAAAQAREDASARELAERRSRMIDECLANHGYEDDCAREVEIELRAEAMQSGGRVIRLRPPAMFN